MRFVRSQAPGSDAVDLGVLGAEGVHDLEQPLAREVPRGDMRAFLELPSARREAAAAEALASPPHAEAVLRAPLANPGKLLAVAGGYYPPGAERLSDEATPYLFAKRTDDIAGPGDPIVLPELARDVIEEIEIAIVIGAPGRDIPADRALEHVAAYTICNDVSGRTLNLPAAGRRNEEFDRFIDWIDGKWFDGFAILGPALVTPDEVPNLPTNARIVTRVSGATRVEGNTTDLIHPFGELIAFASRFMTLQTGDVIATGMPHGAEAEVYLRAGDTVEGEIDGLGLLTNPVVA
ncbi:MAG TPA: fumarylacetoacetate hydrolase family protein [Conexibacter sp.]|jgi:acylpyruvate hydrolase|nr:fumarylacetoacetate hydrolase family protein [Conexibacter sp.]